MSLLGIEKPKLLVPFKKRKLSECWWLCQMQTTQYVFTPIYKIKYNKFLPNIQESVILTS